MSFFRRTTDPMNDRARELDQKIAILQNELTQLQSQLSRSQPAPAARPTPTPSAAPQREPESDLAPRACPPIEESSPPQYNEMGVRKFDLIAAWRRLARHLSPRQPDNPKLVSYLAAGNIQGLPSLRHEQRVARNRFIVLSLILLAVLWGVLSLLLPQL